MRGCPRKDERRPDNSLFSIFMRDFIETETLLPLRRHSRSRRIKQRPAIAPPMTDSRDRSAQASEHNRGPMRGCPRNKRPRNRSDERVSPKQTPETNTKHRRASKRMDQRGSKNRDPLREKRRASSRHDLHRDRKNAHQLAFRDRAEAPGRQRKKTEPVQSLNSQLSRLHSLCRLISLRKPLAGGELARQENAIECSSVATRWARLDWCRCCNQS